MNGSFIASLIPEKGVVYERTHIICIGTEMGENSMFLSHSFLSFSDNAELLNA